MEGRAGLGNFNVESLPNAAESGNPAVPSGVHIALQLAMSQGWAVFPLNPATGRPYDNAAVAAALRIPEPPKGEGGCHLARCDQQSVIAMWTAFPDAQIGIATGGASGIYVLDIDRKNGKDGFAAMDANGWYPPETLWTNTPSGGRHYFFAIPRDDLRRWKTDVGGLGPGIDRKGDGGFVRFYGSAFGYSGDLTMVPPLGWMVADIGSEAEQRHELGEPSLAAPSIDWLKYAFSLIDPNNLDRSEWIALTAAFKQAGWLLAPPETLFAIWSSWCAQYQVNDLGENLKQWNSIRNTELGWHSLVKRVPSLQAAVSFGGQAAQTNAISSSGPAAADLAGPNIYLSEFLTADEQQRWFEGCILIGPDNSIIDKKGIVYGPSAFNSTYGGKRFIIDSNGNKTDEAWKAATRSTLCTIPKVDGTSFRPDEPTGNISIDELGRRSVNIYIPAKIERMEGDPSPFLKHLAMMIPNQDDQRILLDYMAHNAKYPGYKIPWAPVIQSTEGTGKNIFKYAMTYVMGNHYTYPPNAKELAAGGGKFNDWMYRKLFLIADEIKTDDKRDLVEVLKPMISETTLEMQGKGRDQRKADNPANWLFFTNYKDAIPVHANGRRYAIFYSAIQSLQDLQDRGMNDAYFNWFYDDWLGAKSHKTGLKIIANYLFNYPIERGAIPMRAPHTSSTNEAIVAGRGWLENMIAEAVEDGRNGFRNGWISTSAVTALLRERGKDVASRTMGEAIKALGYHQIGQAGRGWFQDDAQNPARRPYLWNIDPHANINDYARGQGYE